MSVDVAKPKKQTLASYVLAWFSPPYIYVDFESGLVHLEFFFPWVTF